MSNPHFTHPHSALATHLHSVASEADVLNLSSAIAKELREDWNLPITSQEVFAMVGRWSDAARPPKITRLTLPGRPVPKDSI